MKKCIFSALLLLLIANLCHGQDPQRYATLAGEADALYEKKEFLLSGQKYAEAFAVNGGKGKTNDRYNAACSWALANQVDSAFVQLYKASMEGGYANYVHITSDSDLNLLHADKRWEEIMALVKANKEKAEANLDKPLVAILDQVYYEDQHHRHEIDSVNQKHGWESAEMKALWKIIEEKDSLNLLQVKKILDERGWLGRDIVGAQGNTTLFLVIQHADLPTQEKYLPLMQEAAKKGNANPANLALLEDRVALRQGKRQIYGSQVSRDEASGQSYVLPLDDPDHVDERRASVGLGKLQDYVGRWGITWDVEAYKKMLPEIELKQKK